MQSLSRPSDNGHHAPRRRPFGAVGKELVGSAARACNHVEHPIRRNSGFRALDGKGTRQIQKIFALMTRLRLRQVQGRKFPLEAGCHLRANLHAAGADAGPDGHPKSCRIGSKDLPHVFDGLVQNVRRRSPPTGVDRGIAAGLRIRQKHREAVRNLHRDGNAAFPGRQRIRLLRAIQIIGGFGHNHDPVGMNLPDGGQSDFRESHSLQEDPAILGDAFAGVPGESRQVKRSGGAKTRRETVTEGSPLFQGTAYVENDTFRLAAVKAPQIHGIDSGSLRRGVSTELRKPFGPFVAARIPLRIEHALWLNGAIASSFVSEPTMILGIGVDIVDIRRLRRALERQSERFLKRVFTTEEQDYCRGHRDPVPHLAARFAAKEAAFKALATGWAKGVGWLEVEVQRPAGGAPVLVLHGNAQGHGRLLGVQKTHLSLSHSDEAAVAIVVLER